MQTTYPQKPLRLSDQDLGRITFWLGLVSAFAFTFACAAVLWGVMTAEAAA